MEWEVLVRPQHQGGQHLQTMQAEGDGEAINGEGEINLEATEVVHLIYAVSNMSLVFPSTKSNKNL